MTIPFSDDQSMQKAGANLYGIDQPYEEVARLYAIAEEAKEKLSAGMGKVSGQMQDQLPAADKLRGEVESVATRTARANSSAEFRALAADARPLHAMYKREHETDEDRLAGGRGGREREKRADVTVAERDN